MTSKIKILDEQTINKIAAGEVIENPASVVKELVENAIDAGSDKITVEIAGGGRQLIRISDNGCGMMADDALLCLERHATSKIRSVEDIAALHSMGFRGEAIPSIASISRFSLLTAPAETNESKQELNGTMIIVEGGKIFSCKPAVRSQGTTIEVKSLFFNVPVRKKFQKSPAQDSNEIFKMLSLLALGHPSISFELISNQKPLLQGLPSLSNAFEKMLAERIKEVLGEDFLKQMVPVECAQGDYKLQGFIGEAYTHRQNRSGQYLFINKRAVYSPVISYAIKEAYGTMLPSQRHPVFVLHLSLPGSHIDVNVHPQKKEVRLRQEPTIKKLIGEAIGKSLQQKGYACLAKEAFSTPFTVEESPFSLPWDSYSLATMETGSRQSCQEEQAELKFKPEPFSLPSYPSTTVQKEFLSAKEIFDRKTPSLIAAIKGYLLIDSFSLGSDDEINTGASLVLIDQQAAYKRILFERFFQSFSKTEETPGEVETLLIPLTFDLPPYEASLMKEHLLQLRRMGFSIREFGLKTFAVEALPIFFDCQDLGASLISIVQELNGFNGDGADGKKAIQAALKAASFGAGKMAGKNRRLSTEEGKALLAQLFQCETPFRCPLGKPIIAYLTEEELSKKFQ